MLNHSNSVSGTFKNGVYIPRTLNQNTSEKDEFNNLLDAINEEKLCVLRFINSRVKVDFLDITNPFDQKLFELKELCQSQEASIDSVIDYIQRTRAFDELNKGFNYCENIAAAYQGVIANSEAFLKDILERYQSIQNEFQENPEEYDYINALNSLKSNIYQKYELWCKAYAIDLTYKKCKSEDNILTYSHRIIGWADPVYQLTPNFSLELKTNFGYGSASYFYTKLKYKNIEITPFSDWIHYQFAQFNQIVRYTKSHKLIQQSWYEAMSFTKDACNLSLSDEQGFVDKYIIGECEEMVSGLEKILISNELHFKRGNDLYKHKFNGHELVVFRGEKITGALDFIIKILQFEGIAKMSGFVRRIEQSNRKLYPHLVSELNLLEEKINKATQDRIELQPECDALKLINQEFNSKKQQLLSQMITSGKLDKTTPDLKVLENAFHLAEPGYAKFSEKFNDIQNTYVGLTSTILTCSEYKNSISLSIKKVKAYFQ
jgi:hypothetical protein